MNIFEIVKKLLIDNSRLRDDDKDLTWHVWQLEGLAASYMTKEAYMRGTSAESITRARRKVQELYPQLRASGEVFEMRHEKEETKGNFIYSELY